MKKQAAHALGILLSLVMVLSMTGCDKIPMLGFEDYDVSGYMEGYLESSYLKVNTAYMEVTGATQERAQENNEVTISNAANEFCSEYSILPDDDQMTELKQVIEEAYLKARFSVADEQKTSTGYYVEVKMEPLKNIKDCAPLLNETKEKIRAKYEQGVSSAVDSDDGLYNKQDNSGDYYEEDEDDDDEEGIEPPMSEPEVDYDKMNREIVSELIQVVRNSLLTASYEDETTIILDILLNEKGELLVDTTQLNLIDKTVVLIK